MYLFTRAWERLGFDSASSERKSRPFCGSSLRFGPCDGKPLRLQFAILVRSDHCPSQTQTTPNPFGAFRFRIYTWRTFRYVLFFRFGCSKGRSRVEQVRGVSVRCLQNRGRGGARYSRRQGGGTGAATMSAGKTGEGLHFFFRAETSTKFREVKEKLRPWFCKR